MPNDIINSARLYHALPLKHWQLQADTEAGLQRILPRHKRIEEKALFNQRQSIVLEGDEIVDRVRYILSQGLGFIRSKTQIKIHEKCLAMCLPKIYGTDWDDNQDAILHRFGVEKLRQELLVIMPRREGKTFAMSMFCAALLVAVPDIEVSVFATGERIAMMLADTVKQMIKRLYDNGYINKKTFRHETANKQRSVWVGPDGTRRVLGAYPGSSKVKKTLFYTGACVCVRRSFFFPFFHSL